MPVRPKKHHFLHIATVDIGGDVSSLDADSWYWCPACGTLSLHHIKFWKPPLMVTGKTLPKGSNTMPDCV